jgi:2-desacetyl-2-hydroxyethyl bacteriochlorophyllide A dehydrogenase
MLAVYKSGPVPGIDVLDRPEPDLVRSDMVRVEVGACGICGTDLDIYHWGPVSARLITVPRILGHEVAGTVVETGHAVSGFKVGDRVVLDTSGRCGKCYYCRLGRFNHCLDQQDKLGQQIDGGMTRFVVVPEITLNRLPEGMPFEEASVIQPMTTAMHCIERVNITPGDDVAIIGPGPIGQLTAMLAERAGAHRIIVLGMSIDQPRLQMARDKGYDVVVSDRDDPVAAVRELTGGWGVEVAIDASGGAGTLGLAIDLIRMGGHVGIIGHSPPGTFDASHALTKEATIYTTWRRLPVTWDHAINLAATRKVDVRSLITHRLPLGRVREAFEALERREAMKAIMLPE